MRAQQTALSNLLGRQRRLAAPLPDAIEARCQPPIRILEVRRGINAVIRALYARK